VGLVILAAVVDFNLSTVIYKSRQKVKRKSLLIFSLILNLGLLGYFKYTDFFIGIINDIQNKDIQPLKLILPVGISFYTFENISYTIDIYRRSCKPVKRFMDYLYFLSFFPKLMMGPIVRAADFIPQIRKAVWLTGEDVSKGLFLILTGCFKKVIISDYLSTHLVNSVFDDPLRYSGIECLMAVYGYALVIYCDFSGYSDMAIGIAKWMGIDVNINFNAPYQSKSITEFWRRWHVSLSSWFRDYLYIPLGGNKFGLLKTCKNILIVMIIGGLWHGASFNFIIWGALHGFFLCVEKINSYYFKIDIKIRFIKKIYTFVYFNYFTKNDKYLIGFNNGFDDKIVLIENNIELFSESKNDE
jgi:D-alanyl-lipoteichoic acid acyltransferase DltB (MBOAT superfamily)